MSVSGADVHVGQDGWMFLVGGANDVIRYYTEPNYFDNERQRLWLALLQERNRRAAALGARYCHVIAPEKISVYPEHFGGRLPFFEAAPSFSLPALEATSRGARTLVDVIGALAGAKAHRSPLYFRTDTHWTPEAVDAVAAATCAQLGTPYGDNFAMRPRGEASLVLDLGGKFVPPVSETWHIRRPSGRLVRTSANRLVTFKETHQLEHEGGLHVGSAVSFLNNSPVVDARLVVFGDSFSEYRDHLLFGALAENFRESHFVWSSQLDWAYIAALKPDFVISELAERFMNIVPSTDIVLESFVEERLNAFKASNARSFETK